MASRPMAPQMASILPVPAEMPCAVVRMRVGKHSVGIRKIVELGPKFAKKYVRP